MNPAPGVPHPGTDDLALRLAVLTTLLAAALALAFAGLITAPVGALTIGLTVTVGLVVPRWLPWLEKDSPHRTVVALAAIGLLQAVTAGSSPGAMFSGDMSGPLGAAVTELAIPDGVPLGLLAALAAGGLVAVPLEFADRRGIQSGLMLGIAVLGLATVAAPGAHLLPALIPGWPAAMFALTKLTASATLGPRSARQTGRTHRAGRAGRQDARLPLMHRAPTTSTASARAMARWQVVPILVVIPVSLAALTLALVSGAATMSKRDVSFGSPDDGENSSGPRESGYLGGQMDLSARGALSSDPLFNVPADSPGLWRVGTLDQYSGRGWQATIPARGLPRFVLGSGGTAQLLDPAQLASPLAFRTDQIGSRSFHVKQLEAGGLAQVLAPGRLLSVTSPALVAEEKISGGKSADGKGVVTAGDQTFIFARWGGGSEYEVRSQVQPGTSDQDAEKTLNATTFGSTTSPRPIYDEALDPRWTSVPVNLPERVRVLGTTLVNRAPSRLAAVRAIEAELARRMTYTLDSPVPPSGADTVDDVLFVSRSGFCEHFASAEVVLLRAAGIPARMAIGFSGGTPVDDQLRTIKRSDAHAWVEVWFPGIGWVNSDPTPSAEVTTGRWQAMRDVVRSLVHQPATWIITALLLIAVSTGVLLLFRRRLKQDAADHPARTMDADLAAAFARLEAGLRAEGRPRAPNETVSALARRLARQRKSDQPEEVSDPAIDLAFLTLERALYASQPPSRQECLTAATAIGRRADAQPR